MFYKLSFLTTLLVCAATHTNGELIKRKREGESRLTNALRRNSNNTRRLESKASKSKSPKASKGPKSPKSAKGCFLGDTAASGVVTLILAEFWLDVKLCGCTDQCMADTFANYLTPDVVLSADLAGNGTVTIVAEGLDNVVNTFLASGVQQQLCRDFHISHGAYTGWTSEDGQVLSWQGNQIAPGFGFPTTPPGRQYWIDASNGCGGLAYEIRILPEFPLT